MIYLKATLVGLVTGLAVAVAWAAVKLFAPLVLQSLRGAGGLGAASVGSDSILVAGAVGFVLGFAWMWRRRNRPATSSAAP